MSQASNKDRQRPNPGVEAPTAINLALFMAVEIQIATGRQVEPASLLPIKGLKRANPDKIASLLLGAAQFPLESAAKARIIERWKEAAAGTLGGIKAPIDPAREVARLRRRESQLLRKQSELASDLSDVRQKLADYDKTPSQA